MVYTKDEYRYLVTEKEKSKLIAFRVPKDFPLNNSQVKLIIAEMDKIIADEDINYKIESLQYLDLSDEALKSIIELMEYYKERKPILDKRMGEQKE